LYALYQMVLFPLTLSDPYLPQTIPFLGRLPNYGSRPNTMGGNFPSVHTSVRPQKVSSILMKFGMQVVLNER